MGEIDLQTMMIHVERIVRPVRATARRKLQMRRELLAHLQATLEEEQTAGADPQAAWKSATSRLGVPAELTRDLQKSVPLAERLIIWTPVESRWKKPHDMRLNAGLVGMSGGRQILFAFACTVLIFGWWPLAVRQWKEGMESVQYLPWGSWRIGILLWAIVTCALGAPLGILAFRIVDAGARPTGWRHLVNYGIATTTLVLAMRVNWCFLGAGPWTDLAWTPAVGVIMTAGLAWLGRFLRPGIRDFGEWFSLDVAA